MNKPHYNPLSPILTYRLNGRMHQDRVMDKQIPDAVKALREQGATMITKSWFDGQHTQVEELT